MTERHEPLQPTPEEAPARRRRRPGRFRRWVVRPLAWGLTLLVLLVFAAAVLLDSDLARDYARRQAVDRLSALLDRPVAIEKLDFNLLALEATAQGVTVGDVDPAAPPLLAVERVRLAVRLSGWSGTPVLGLRWIEVERPRIHIELRADGTSNIPKLTLNRDGKPKRVEVRVGTLVVRDGELLLDERRLPLDLSAQAVRGRLTGGGPEGELLGQVVAQEVKVTLPRARPYLGAVAARLTLRKGLLTVGSARVSGPDLAATVGGTVRWGEERRVDLDGEVRAQAAVLDRLGYLEGQIAGPLRFRGGLEWTPGDWKLRGMVSSAGLLMMERRVEDLAGELVGDPNGLHLTLARASYGGGALGGTVSVALGPADHPSEIDLVFHRVLLRTLLADQHIPIAALAGRADGVFNYRFVPSRSRAGSGWAEIAVTSADLGGDRIPWMGTVPLVIEGGRIETQALRLTSDAQRVEAQGYFDLEREEGRFDYRITTGRLEQLLTLLPAAPPPPAGEPVAPELWRPTEGRGELAGALLLAPSGAVTELTMDLYDVVAPGARGERVHGTLRVSERGLERLELELARADAALRVSGTLPFAPTPATTAPAGPAAPPAAPLPLALVVDAVRWPIADAAPWLPFEVPVAGPLSGVLELGGDLDHLRGRLEATAAPAEIFGLPVARCAATLSFDPAEVRFERVVASDEAGAVRLAGRADLVADRLALTIESDRLDLSRAPFAALLAQGFAGGLELSGAIGGSLERPELDLEGDAGDLAVGERALGQGGAATFTAHWDGEHVDLHGSLLGLVELDGGGRLDGDGLALDLAAQGDALELLAAALGAEKLPPFSGSFAGRLELSQEFAASDLPGAHLRLERLRIDYQEHSFVNQEPVDLALDAEALTIGSLFLVDTAQGNELFVAGRVGLADDPTLDLRLQSTLAFDWLELLVEGVDLDGSVDLLATVRGTASQPAFNGEAEISGARAVFPALNQSAEELTGTVLFYPRQIVVDSATAQVAGGRLRASGAIDLYSSPDGAWSYRFQFSGKGFSVRYPEGWLMQGDAELQLASAAVEGRQLTGVITLSRALYVQPVEIGLAQVMQGLFQRQRLQLEATDELSLTTQLNLLVLGNQALRIRNNLANLSGSIDLTVRGSLAKPVLFGRVEMNPDGTLEYSANRYRVERAVLNFVNPYRVEPVVDLVATTRTGEYDVTLNLSGTLDRLNATFSSDPPLPDLEILALVTTGQQSTSSLVTDQPSDAGVGAEGFLYGQAASLISSRVNHLFGLERFRIDPLTSGSGGPTSARVTVGKRLSRDLFATYSYDPSQTKEQILQLEWQVSPTFALVLTQNGDGSYAVDGRWEKRF